MLWLAVAISAYLLLAIVALVDKYLISGPIPSPKVYVFYIGLFGILSLFLIPLGFVIPQPIDIVINFIAGSIYLFAILGLIGAFKFFEVSRIIPAIGGFLPIFTLVLGYLILGTNEALGPFEILSFVFLIS